VANDPSGALKTGSGKRGSGNLQGRIQRGPNPNPRKAANIRPNADFTSLKYIEYIIFHAFQRKKQEIQQG